MHSLKIHRSYRNVMAVCDSNLLGKRFEEGKMQLDVRENFFKSQEVETNELIRIMELQKKEDSTFNIVGSDSVKAALKAGIISEGCIGKVQNIPFALILN